VDRPLDLKSATGSFGSLTILHGSTAVSARLQTLIDGALIACHAVKERRI